MPALCSQCGRPSDTYAPDPSLTAHTPRFSALLASNEPPSDAELQELRWRLHVMRDHRAAVDERIASLRAGLASALAEKDCMEEYEENTRNILFPSRRFPTEVLSQIFECYVGDVLRVSYRQLEEGSFVDSLDTSKGPWLLSHVSSGWRRVALSLPPIWTTVNLTFDRYKSDKRFSSTFLLAALLPRTGAHQLQLNLHATSDISEHPAIPSVVVTCPRWRTLQVSLSMKPLYTILAFPCDALESTHFNVSLELSDYHSILAGIKPPSFTAPRLRSVSATNFAAITIIEFSVPWQQIVSCQQIKRSNHACSAMNRWIPYYSVAAVYLLHEALHLRHATLYVCGINSNALGSINCGSLESLTLVGPTAARNHLFLNLRLPRITSLRFEDLDEEGHDQPQALPNPLDPLIGHCLKELGVSIGEATDEEAFVALLQTVPNVVTLELSCYDRIDDRFAALLSNDNGILPKLETIVVKRCPVVTMSLVGCIRERRAGENGMVALKKVVVHGGDEDDEYGVRAAMDELVADGLEVVRLSAVDDTS